MSGGQKDSKKGACYEKMEKDNLKTQEWVKSLWTFRK